MPCFCWISDDEITEEMKIISNHMKEIVAQMKIIHGKGDLYPSEKSSPLSTLPTVMYRDKELNPITLEKWGELFEDSEYRVIKREKFGNFIVSTVWIGVWHFDDIFFETIVFDENLTETYRDRYRTLDEAINGHHLAIESLKNPI